MLYTENALVLVPDDLERRSGTQSLFHKMMVSVLAAVLEFQRDMISENTREGVAAAEAAGKTLGRPTALDSSTATAIVAAYRQGAAVKGLAGS
ncbi:recombinase family protein [Streptosporangium roseum]|uniref:recombinase family protein n=1 Tax=Streptosporangium roseum TaxID=2001 RepID=UPI0009DD8A9E|nr:recombinase family protein [Streptosporangium roseum]